jgi:tetratricopeptide (TPR) repeat protein
MSQDSESRHECTIPRLDPDRLPADGARRLGLLGGDRAVSALRAALSLLLLAAIPLEPAPLAAQWPPEKLENLKFFPEDTEVRELMQTMSGFTFALGVRCPYCHVGEEGQPLSSFDFASDAKETKERARAMLRMVKAINGEHLPALGKERDEILQVECVTCHRGLARPEQLSDILSRTALESGLDAAIEKYGELRREHYGSASYDFGPGSLVRAAEALLAEEQVKSAIALLELNLEHYPESQWTLSTLAKARVRNNDREGAIQALEKLLELNPDNARTKRQIEEIRREGDGR